MRALPSSIAGQSALMEFIGQLSCPNLLLSYEKTLSSSEDLIDLIHRFCDIPPSAALGTRMLAIIEPNRPRYLATARRPFGGLIEGVRDGQLYGWCWPLRLPEPVTLDVLVDGRLVLTRFGRTGLMPASATAGMAISSGSRHCRRGRTQIRVRVARYGVALVNSGTRLCDFDSAAA
jgi:hypothetical protein